MFPYQYYCHAGDPLRHLSRLSCNEISNDNRSTNPFIPSSTSNELDDQYSVATDGLVLARIAVSCQHRLGILRQTLCDRQYYQGSYLEVMKFLVSTGLSMKSSEVTSMLKDILKSSNPFFITKMNFFLQQFHCWQPERNELLALIDECLVLLPSSLAEDSCPSSNCRFLASKLVLEYIFFMLVENFVSSDGCKGLLREVVLASKWSWHVKFLDIASSLSQLNCVECKLYTECISLMLSYVVFPLIVSQSGSEQDDICNHLARDISSSSKELANPLMLLLNIPSEILRERTIDHHLDHYFLCDTTEEIGGPFTLLKFKNVHLLRNPRKPDGSRHDLGYFLSLLTSLLQSHLLVLSGVSLVSFIPKKSEAIGSVCDSLKELHIPIMMLVNRLSSDPETSSHLTTPTSWYHLELLMTLTS